MVGFSQLGAESDWRSANTESMKETFTTENGYKLILEDGQQKQVNQIAAIRSFIQQDVDYIVLAPVTETGWDTVLQLSLIHISQVLSMNYRLQQWLWQIMYRISICR